MVHEDSTETNLIWFVAGALVGAGIALLFAPQPGIETRRRLRSHAGRGRDVLAQHGRGLVDTGRTLFEHGRGIADEAAEMLERGRQLIEE
jgi:gas vesicle protein